MSLRNGAQQSPSRHVVENIPGTPASPSRATERTARRTGFDTASPSRTGEPSVISAAPAAGGVLIGLAYAPSPARQGDPPMDFALTDRCIEFQERLTAFMDERVYPAEAVYEEQLREAGDPHAQPTVMEELKEEARSRG